jgi:hypothetical protein
MTCIVAAMRGVLLAVLTAIVLATLAATVGRPIWNRLGSRWMTLTDDHGIRLRVITKPSELANLNRAILSFGVDPVALSSVSFYFNDGPPDESPPIDESWWGWASRHAGEDVYYSHVLLLVQSTQDRTVVLKPPVVNRRVAPTDSGVICTPLGLGGNGLLVRRFYIDLDEAEPIARYIDGSDERESAYFEMGRGSTEPILLVAKAARGRHKWRVQLPLVIDGEDIVLTADRDGQPFITVGPENVRTLGWLGSRWVEIGHDGATLEPGDAS